MTGIHETILEQMKVVNENHVPSYGYDIYTKTAEDEIEKLFEKPVKLALCMTAVAANALSLAAMAPGTGLIYCTSCSAIFKDSYGAIQLQADKQVRPLPEKDGKLILQALQEQIDYTQLRKIQQESIIVSISQPTEYGTIYSLKEIEDIAKIVHAAGYQLHMDGQRFAYALAALNCSPAEATWKIGIDCMTLGGTSNGCLMLDAVISFTGSKITAHLVELRRKQVGQTCSQVRFLSAQLLAYIKDNLWLKLADHSNKMATLLKSKMAVQSAYTVSTNQFLFKLLKEQAKAVDPNGDILQEVENCLFRIMTHFQIQENDVDAIASYINQRIKVES